jgi:hypothetical protein
MAAIIFGIFVGILTVVFILIWALLKPSVKCPDCGEPLPKFRKPKSRRQALLGGTTCKACGCEVDRKGRKIVE